MIYHNAKWLKYQRKRKNSNYNGNQTTRKHRTSNSITIDVKWTERGREQTQQYKFGIPTVVGLENRNLPLNTAQYNQTRTVRMIISNNQQPWFTLIKWKCSVFACTSTHTYSLLFSVLSLSPLNFYLFLSMHITLPK